jgi:iron(III) transport system permease protein
MGRFGSPKEERRRWRSVIAVAMLDLWVDGQGGELAAFGLLWTVVMTLLAFGFFHFVGARSVEAYR